MAQICTVCAHPETKEIEQKIIQGIAHTTIADQFGLNHLAIRRHSENHLPEKLVRHVSKQEREHTQDLFGNIQSALDEANDILREARNSGQNRLSLDAIKTILSANELFAKMIAKVKEHENTDQERKDSLAEQYATEGLEALTTPELKAWIGLKAKILSANSDHELDPEVRMFVDSVDRGKEYDEKMHHNNYNNSNPQSDSPQTHPAQPKNTKNEGSTHVADDSVTEFEDTDEDLDLELDDLDLNEEPDWLVKYREKNPSLPKPGGGRPS